MAASYQAKNQSQLQRQLKVQKLSIPFVIVGNATSSSVAVSNDEPAVMFIKTAGVDQITPALASGETATYSVSPVDASGIFNILVKIQEPVQKIVSCHAHDTVLGTLQPVKLGSSSGISVLSSGLVGQSIMLTCTASQSIATSNTVNGTLEVEYAVNEH